jgi:hypothetical protein
MPDPFHEALQHILSPLARLMIGKGISYGQACELLKIAMVKEATNQDGNDITDSRVSVKTGIHRKEVKRIRAEKEDTRLNAEGSIYSQVLAKWLALGEPPPVLNRIKDLDGQTTFETLVLSISNDVRPRAVLEELLERGVVKETTKDTFALQLDKLIIGQSEASKTRFLGMNIHDHLSVAVDNILETQNPQLERCVFFQGLSEQASKELHDMAEEQAMQALLALNSAGQEMIKDSKNHGDQRVNFGMYFYKGSQS